MTAGQITIEWGNLERMFAAMNKVGDQAFEIDVYFGDKVCDPSGFAYDSCALKPIGDMLPMVAGYFDDMRRLFNERWQGVGDAIHNTARQVDIRDGGINHVFTNYRGSNVPSHLLPAPIDVDIEVFEIAALGAALGEPEAGSEKLNHNNAFDAAAATWETARDTINWGIDLINRAGVGVPRLSELSLRDYIVYPLSANYAQIQSNASACQMVDGAMQQWGGNFTQLSGKVVLGLEGQAGLALVAQLNLYGAVMRLVGKGVGEGSLVFEQIATMSERIAVEVEDVLVILGKKLAKLSSKIASRFVPGLGWVLLAIDIARTKGAVIQDILDDIEQCRQILDDCFALVEEIQDWAQTQADRLAKFQELLEVVKQLPVVGDMVPLDQLSTDLSDVEGALSDVADFGSPEGGETDALDGELEGLGDNDYEDSSSSGTTEDPYAPNDDGVLMAPGPPLQIDPETGELVQPPYGSGSGSGAIA